MRRWLLFLLICLLPLRGWTGVTMAFQHAWPHVPSTATPAHTPAPATNEHHAQAAHCHHHAAPMSVLVEPDAAHASAEPAPSRTKATCHHDTMAHAAHPDSPNQPATGHASCQTCDVCHGAMIGGLSAALALPLPAATLTPPSGTAFDSAHLPPHHRPPIRA